jgi:hypothetical protein
MTVRARIGDRECLRIRGAGGDTSESHRRRGHGGLGLNTRAAQRDRSGGVCRVADDS